MVSRNRPLFRAFVREYVSTALFFFQHLDLKVSDKRVATKLVGKE
jgi:hypothetical protein